MKLGPIQEAWVTSLEQHPERQMRGALGMKQPDGSYKACCLGEGGLIAGVCGWQEDGTLSVLGRDAYWNSSVLEGDAYKALGLRNPEGSFKIGTSIYSLSSMNDMGKTWVELATFIRANPEKVFTHSV